MTGSRSKTVRLVEIAELLGVSKLPSAPWAAQLPSSCYDTISTDKPFRSVPHATGFTNTVNTQFSMTADGSFPPGSPLGTVSTRWVIAMM
jgi:hypothetical protein